MVFKSRQIKWQSHRASRVQSPLGNNRLRHAMGSGIASHLFPRQTRPRMPTYEYQCEKCKKSFEYRQPMADAALTVCPKDACQQKKWGKGRVKRQIGTGAGLIFKGSGFYITDYRSESYREAAKKDAPVAPANVDKPAAKEGKAAPAAATPAKPETKPKKQSAE